MSVALVKSIFKVKGMSKQPRNLVSLTIRKGPNKSRLAIDISLDCSVRDFKSKLEKEFSVPVDRQRLISWTAMRLLGRVLDDEKLISTYREQLGCNPNICCVRAAEKLPELQLPDSFIRFLDMIISVPPLIDTFAILYPDLGSDLRRIVGSSWFEIFKGNPEATKNFQKNPEAIRNVLGLNILKTSQGLNVFEREFQVELQELREMGFTNTQDNLHALLVSKGSTNDAIKYMKDAQENPLVTENSLELDICASNIVDQFVDSNPQFSARSPQIRKHLHSEEFKRSLATLAHLQLKPSKSLPTEESENMPNS